MAFSAPFRIAALTLCTAVLAGCGAEPAPEAAPAAAAAAGAAAFDWSRCRVPGLALPAQGRLFVVDGGAPGADAESGREAIRRVDVFVPGPVALLLTSRDATAWHVRPSPQTQVQAVFASGEGSQRITGQGLGDARVAFSSTMGDACGRYWIGDDAALADVTREVFGRPQDALYRMRGGLVVIGGAESFEPESLGPGR